MDFPHAVQALRIRRRRLNATTGRWSTVTVDAITNLNDLNAGQASPTDLADALRGHWAIEILHHIRDTTYAEDASRQRTPRHGHPAQHRDQPAPPCLRPARDSARTGVSSQP
ncbi:hypothetical protein [Micromonospora sp. WMMD980]|uniref:hypothetical protein n=1 Tax=Micromonospora sp. WMMD980 TaxID=3016088 RepID=UPI002416924E|nr:hypothetical protein [Micromonospora sp. WMMD980]MDG4803558.1 hypothetical protein [Micromonospora sp. WMMD980]